MDSSSLAAVLWRDLRSIMRVNKESNLLAQTMLPVQEVCSRGGGRGRGVEWIKGGVEWIKGGVEGMGEEWKG